MKHRIHAALLTVALVALPCLASATQLTYDLVWNGSNGYQMTGQFSFAEAAAADGAIIDGEVESLSIEVFQNAVSLGRTDVSTALPGFSFNFDPIAMRFPARTTPDGNQWNFRQANGVGFSYGGNASAVSVGRDFLGFIFHNDPAASLSATPTGTVPLPGTTWLLLAGMIALIGSLRHRWARQPHRVSMQPAAEIG